MAKPVDTFGDDFEALRSAVCAEIRAQLARIEERFDRCAGKDALCALQALARELALVASGAPTFETAAIYDAEFVEIESNWPLLEENFAARVNDAMRIKDRSTGRLVIAFLPEIQE